MGANTASVIDSVRADIEPQSQKAYVYTKPAHRQAVQIVPAYYFPASRAEPPKTSATNQRKKSSSSKRGTSKKPGNRSSGSQAQTESSSHDDSVKPQSKTVVTPNQIASEYLDAYFNYLKAYSSNQEKVN